MLRVIDISYSRNEVVLFTKVDFTVAAGEALQIRAANGVGKTTLLKILARINSNFSGKVICAAETIYLGHQNNLHPALTPLQNLSFLHGIKVTDPKLVDALQLAGLEQVKFNPCGELSAGQLQRVNIARLYLTNSALWLLDEPLVNLDQAARKIFLQLCAEHLTRSGACVFATHSELNIPDFSAHTLNLEEYA